MHLRTAVEAVRYAVAVGIVVGEAGRVGRDRRVPARMGAGASRAANESGAEPEGEVQR